ncbi:MAG: hypothetical protein QOE32_207, partial [Pseudonocardiales bacterium]|nr:hypothetical protein [Pseudonocardiales bacterium]
RSDEQRLTGRGVRRGLIVRVGLAALAVTDWGYPVTFVVAGGVSTASAELIARLQRPGLSSTLPRAHCEAQLIG